jgi:hypothetical protein
MTTTNERCPDCSRLRQPVQQAGLIGRGPCCKHFPWGSPDVARMAIEDCAAHKARASVQDADEVVPKSETEKWERQWENSDYPPLRYMYTLPQWVARETVRYLQHRADSPAVSAQVAQAIADIRKSDCGGWLKDGLEGREKRMELMRLLDTLYKAAGNKEAGNGN